MRSPAVIELADPVTIGGEPLDQFVPVGPALVRRRCLDFRLDQNKAAINAASKIEFASIQNKLASSRPKILIPDPPPAGSGAAIEPPSGIVLDPFKVASTLASGRRYVRVTAINLMRVGVPDDALPVAECDALSSSQRALCNARAE